MTRRELLAPALLAVTGAGTLLNGINFAHDLANDVHAMPRSARELALWSGALILSALLLRDSGQDPA